MGDWYSDYKKYSSQTWEPMRLSSQEEEQFRAWMKETKWFKQIKDDVALSGYEISSDELLDDIVGHNADYDYRKAWKNGVAPIDYEYDNRQHWASSLPDGTILKSPHHPTTWMEFFMRETGDDPVAIGLRTPEEAHAYSTKLKRQ